MFGSTAISLGLHLALVLAVLQLPSMPLPAVNGLRIELMHTLAAPGQTDTTLTDQRKGQPTVAEQARPADDPVKTNSAVNDAARSIAKAQPLLHTTTPRALANGGDHADGADEVTADTDADTRTAAMLQLLHNEISDHKRYPYLARRQGREGTARIEFVLHPDGHIDNTALLESSRSQALDHAALTAIEHISPFEPATQYLSQAQTFRIDVVFQLR